VYHPAAALQQQDDYYPFGLEISRSILSPKNEYLYNGKELQEETSTYDFGARGYDQLIARWLQMAVYQSCCYFIKY